MDQLCSQASTWSREWGADAAKAQVNAKRARKIATKTMAREFPELVQKISSREVRIIEKSFNSGTAFTNAFVAAGVVGVLVKVHQGVEELKRIGIQLEGIRGELEKQVLAMIGVYETTGFGSFVYKFIKTEIDAYRTSKEKHVFYVYHSDTVWVPDFESLREERSLPQSFGGYSSDIDAIFLLMWSNRQTLLKETEDGADVVFHLLVPSNCSTATMQLFIIDPGVGRLIIKGHRYKATNLAWFNFLPFEQYSNDLLTLSDAGNLYVPPRSGPFVIPLVGSWAVVFIAPLGLLFPRTAPFVGATMLTGFFSFFGCDLAKELSESDLDGWSRVAPQVLGKPSIQTP